MTKGWTPARSNRFLQMAGIVGVCATIGVLAACDQSGSSKSAESPAMQVALMALPASLGNPYTASSTVIQNTYFWSTIFDGLTRIDKDFNVAPALALSWTQRDQNTWDFVLREDVKFSDGETFNAPAVVAALAWLKTPAGRASSVGDQMAHVEAFEAIGENAIRIKTAYPDPGFPSKASWLPIVAPKAWADLGPDGFATKPEGTGPYRVVTLNGGDGRIVLTKNPGSWRKAKIDNLVFRLIPDGVARTQALVSGSVDVGPVTEGEDTLLQDKGIVVDSHPVLRIVSPAFAIEAQDRQTSPLNDVRVRQAMNYAVNKDAIVAQILNGRGRAAGQPASYVSHDYNGDVSPYPYEPERAKALLRDAGYGKGFAVKMIMLAEESAPIKATFQLMAQDLQAVGITVEIKTVTHEMWRASFLNGGWGDTNLFSMSFVSQSNDTVVPIKSFLCSRKNSYFCDPGLDAAVSRVEAQVTPEARAREVKTLMKAFHDSAPVIFLVDLETIFGYGPRLNIGELGSSWRAFEDLSWKPK